MKSLDHFERVTEKEAMDARRSLLLNLTIMAFGLGITYLTVRFQNKISDVMNLKEPIPEKEERGQP